MLHIRTISIIPHKIAFTAFITGFDKYLCARSNETKIHTKLINKPAMYTTAKLVNTKVKGKVICCPLKKVTPRQTKTKPTKNIQTQCFKVPAT